MNWFFLILTIFFSISTARTAGACKLDNQKNHDKYIFYSALWLAPTLFLSYELLWGWIGVIISIGIVGYNYNKGVDMAHSWHNTK